MKLTNNDGPGVSKLEQMSDKVKLGDLLKLFEDAFNAGWEAHAEGNESVRDQAFRQWVDAALEEL
jgi:hypothetical protein